MSKPDIIPTKLETVIDQLTAWYAHSVLTNGPDSPGLTAAHETCERITDLHQASLMLLTEMLSPSEPGLPQAANRLAAAVEAMNTPLLAPRPTQAFLFPLEKEGTA